MKKTVIWGIGHYGRLCAINIGLNNVHFFIDSDKRKCGDFLGKKVFTPDSLSDWNNLHIYIPFNYEREISAKLKMLGVSLEDCVSVYGKNAFITEARAEEEDKRVNEELDEVDFSKYQNGVLFWGIAWALGRDYSKGYTDLITSHSMFVVSEAYWINRKETECILGNSVVVAPLYVTNNVNVKRVHQKVDSQTDILADDIIQDLMASIVAAYPDISEDDAYYKAHKTYLFIESVLKKGKFRYAIINGSDVPEHRMLSSLCNRYGVKTIYTHPAVLPGTLHFDPSGDVGDSIISTYHEEFRELPISHEDLIFARRVLDYLFETGINRKPQPKHNWLQSIQPKLKPNRPTIFYAGQMDLACSMIPYTERTKKFHSPIFKSTLECAIFLSEVCLRNEWNFIYKPHPMFIGDGDKGLPSNVIYVSSGDINEIVDFADVTVTIRSTTNYVALIRGKPVLMLGYTQTRGQGCTYEAFSEKEIAPQLDRALKYGFTKAQRKAFEEHIARLLRYYLYDDMSERIIRYGLPFPSCVEDFFSLEKRLKSMIDE